MAMFRTGRGNDRERYQNFCSGRNRGAGQRQGSEERVPQLPRRLQHTDARQRRRARQGRGRSRRPAESRLPLSDRRGDHAARLSPRPLEISAAPYRATRLRQVGAHLVGRGARRDHRERFSRSVRRADPNRSRWARARAAIISAGCRASATRSGLRTGASPASRSAFTRASTPASRRWATCPFAISRAARRRRSPCTGGTIRRIRAPTARRGSMSAKRC